MIKVNRNVGTFRFDNSLPRLAFPKLKYVINYYLDILFSLLPIHTYFNYKNEIEKLLVDDLNVMEQNLATISMHHNNYVERWWMKMHYLSLEAPILPFSSLFAISSLHPKFWPIQCDKSLDTFVERSSVYARAILLFYKCLRYGDKPPDIKNSYPLSMHSYRCLFQAARVPSNDKDAEGYYQGFRIRCEGSSGEFILISVKGRVFKVDVMHNDELCTLEELETTISTILRQVELKELVNNVTATMCLPKSSYLGALEFSNENNEFLSLVKNSIFWLSFDRSCPSYEESLCALIHSDINNRCPTKSICITVFKNGLIGWTADQALIDPDVLMHTIETVDNHIRSKDDAYSNTEKSRRESVLKNVDFYIKEKIPHFKSDILPFYQIDLEVLPWIDQQLSKFRKSYMSISAMYQTKFDSFNNLNQEVILQWGLNPEIVVHLLILLAYNKHYEKLELPMSCCALISQRHLYRGSHDFVPTLFHEVVAWIEAVNKEECPSSKLRIYFLEAHSRLEKAFKATRDLVSPVKVLNLLSSVYNDKNNEHEVGWSRGLDKLFQNGLWTKSGFRDARFGLMTFCLSSGNRVSYDSMSHVKLALSSPQNCVYSITYEVTPLETCLVINYRHQDTLSDEFLVDNFLKQFSSSIDLLCDMFADYQLPQKKH